MLISPEGWHASGGWYCEKHGKRHVDRRSKLLRGWRLEAIASDFSDHAPAPWRVTKRGEVKGTYDIYDSSSPAPRHVCVVTRDGDAALIARAPDLLAAFCHKCRVNDELRELLGFALQWLRDLRALSTKEAVREALPGMGERQLELLRALQAEQGTEATPEGSHLADDFGLKLERLTFAVQGEIEREFMAYTLVTDFGSDPAVMDVLGLKAGQIEGVQNPEGAILESRDVDAVRKLAESFLRQRGLPLPERATQRTEREAMEGSA